MLLPEVGAPNDRCPLGGAEVCAGGFSGEQYGLFFAMAAFFDFCFEAGRFVACLSDPFVLVSEDEVFKFVRRFIQFEKGRRRECRSGMILAIA